MSSSTGNHTFNANITTHHLHKVLKFPSNLEGLSRLSVQVGINLESFSGNLFIVL